jgi:hypothetical protein
MVALLLMLMCRRGGVFLPPRTRMPLETRTAAPLLAAMEAIV